MVTETDSDMPYKEYKPEKLYRSIGEVAEILGESTSLVRFWSDRFSDFIHPARNNKQNRLFTPADLATLKQIHYLVKDCGMTLDGAAERLKNNKSGVDKKTRIVEQLKEIREELLTVSRSLHVEDPAE